MLKRKCFIFTDKNCENNSVRAKFLLPNLNNPNLLLSWCQEHETDAKEVLAQLGITDERLGRILKLEELITTMGEIEQAFMVLLINRGISHESELIEELGMIVRNYLSNTAHIV